MLTEEFRLRPRQRVLVLRGGGGYPDGIGVSRWVLGKVVRRVNDYDWEIRLLEDDPYSSIPEWSKKGNVGIWSEGACWRAPKTESLSHALGRFAKVRATLMGA